MMGLDMPENEEANDYLRSTKGHRCQFCLSKGF